MALTKQAHLNLSPELHERARKAAEAERRTLSNWLAVVVERALEDEKSDGQEKP